MTTHDGARKASASRRRNNTNKKMPKKAAAGWLCALEAFFFLGLIASIQRHDWSGALFALVVVTGIPTWIVATQTATTCGYITQAGRPCPNPVYGVIFGCGSGKHHTWGKVLQRFGLNANAIRSPSTAARGLETSEANPTAPVMVKVATGARDKALFWIAFGQLVVGVPSFFATMHSLLGHH